MSAKMDIRSEMNAVPYALKYLKQHHNFQWDNIHPCNHSRYCIITGKKNIAIILKKEWFFKFNDKGFIKSNGETETGLGDSINIIDLKNFISKQVKEIYIVFKTGCIYTIPIDEFLIHSHRWTNKEGKEVRSISIHHYNLIYNPEKPQNSKEKLLSNAFQNQDLSKIFDFRNENSKQVNLCPFEVQKPA